jgi:hypothetical protein
MGVLTTWVIFYVKTDILRWEDSAEEDPGVIYGVGGVVEFGKRVTMSMNL